MISLEEAQDLRKRLSNALYEMTRGHTESYQEGEVQLRSETVINLLILIHADTMRMCNVWEELEG